MSVTCLSHVSLCCGIKFAGLQTLLTSHLLKTKVSVDLFFTGLNHVVSVAKTYHTVQEHSHGLLSLGSQYQSQQLFLKNTHGPPLTPRIAVKTVAAMHPYADTGISWSPALTQEDKPAGLSLATGQLCSVRLARGCYKYSNSKA